LTLAIKEREREREIGLKETEGGEIESFVFW